MEADEKRILGDLRDALTAQNRSLVMLVQAHQQTAAVQTEMLRKILEAVTAPVPPSELPDLLETLIALQRDTMITVDRIDEATQKLAARP